MGSEMCIRDRGVFGFIRKEGDKLIVEPVRTGGLLALLATLENIETTFPDTDEALLPPDNVEF